MRRLLLILAGLYASWLGMMAVHESGHVLHAWLSGGTVVRVTVPLIGFSRTDVFPNPSPRFVTWGGPMWGSVWPLLGTLAFRRTRVRIPLMFFAGFCCIANGAYLGAGWNLGDGDAAELYRRGTPAWALIMCGSIMCAVGLWLWHRMGPLQGGESSN